VIESDINLLFKVFIYSSLLVGCGYLLGKDKGVKVGAGRAVDSLCENGYLKHKKQPDGNVELIKLNGEIE
jgi:hypothetical protein|tara:strand:+ start:2367 stop:2576 length:210 start_codon:yes stop_codon:yes gene_type:complete